MLVGHCVRVGYEVVALLFEKFFVFCWRSQERRLAIHQKSYVHRL